MKRVVLSVLVLIPLICSSQQWSQRGSDIVSIGNDHTHFGYSVSSNKTGNVVATGMPDGLMSTENGSVVVSKWLVGSWIEYGAFLGGEDIDDKFGYAVDLNDNGQVLAVGAPLNDGGGIDAGHVRVFTYDIVNDLWVQKGIDIDGNSAGNNFGNSVVLSADGNRVIIGAPYDGSGGKVYIYDWDGTAWVLFQSVQGNYNNELFGWTVTGSSDCNIFAVGAPHSSSTGVNAGSVYWFALDGGSFLDIGYPGSVQTSGDNFGYSIDLSSDGLILAIGSPFYSDGMSIESGTVECVAWDGVIMPMPSFNQIGSILQGYDSERFGFSLSLNDQGDTLAIGSPYYSSIGTKQGQVKVYELLGANWSQIDNPINGTLPLEQLGFSVSLSGNSKYIAVGSPYYDGQWGVEAGVARSYCAFYPSYSTINISSCGVYTSPSGSIYSTSGTYIDVITNSQGCDSILTINLTINPLPTLTTADTSVCANGDDMFLDGLGLPVGGEFVGNYISNNIFNSSDASLDSNQIVYIYTDLNGCTNSDTANIWVYDIPVLTMGATTINCGDSTGVVYATVTPLNATESAYWSTGDTQSNVSGLPVGSYYYYYTDTNHCSVNGVAILESANIQISETITHNLCPGEAFGAIDITVSGSTGPYTYLWNTGDTIPDLNNLLSGQYVVFVTDADGCTTSKSFIVTEPELIEAEIVKTNPTTCSATNGVLDATIIGGTTPYATIEWKNSAGAVIGTTATLSNVGGGIYTLNVIDDNGCLFETTTYLSPTGAPIVTLNQFTNAGCNNSGAIDVNVTSQNAIQSYLWSNGATTEDITNLNAGGYSLQVNDDAGCTGYFYMDLDNELPAHTEICIVTVDTSTVTNLVVWNKPASTDIDYFIIYRETAVVGQYLPIDTVNYNDVSEYNDTTAYPQIRSWRYKITNVNFCGVESALSPPHKTIHLSINTGLGGAYNLAWDDYEGVAYSTFHIWRNTTANGWEDITQATNGLNTSIHTYTDTPPSTIGLDYYIEVTPDAPFSCQSTIKANDYGSTRSNRHHNVSSASDGLIEKTNSQNLSVYPNPSNGEYTISISNSNNQNYTYSVFDIKGDLVKEFVSSKSNIILDIHYLEDGIYILEIKSDDVLFKKQLIKQ